MSSHGIPSACFEIIAWKALAYTCFDACLLILAYSSYSSMLQLESWLAYLLWANITGFIMWICFVLGHECSHRVMLRSPVLNDCMGLMIHGHLMVPFFGWQKSHRLHHAFHNHKTKDRSHVWFSEQDFRSLPGAIQFFLRTPLSSIAGFSMYLYMGIQDGIHVWPLGSLFATTRERLTCIVDDLVLVGWMYVIYTHVCSASATTVLWKYVVPLIIFHVWLIMVTHMQHHDETTIVFDDNSWSHAKGALQTIDREYGFFVDRLTHHITDGHVAHHVSTKIPHYHLAEATRALRCNPGKYKFEKTPYFLFEHMRLRWCHAHTHVQTTTVT